MFSLFKKNPIKKLIAQEERKLEEAMFAQRNGDIKSYAQLTHEADLINQEIVKLKREKQDI